MLDVAHLGVTTNRQVVAVDCLGAASDCYGATVDRPGAISDS
jgi:hypothetical protein